MVHKYYQIKIYYYAIGVHKFHPLNSVLQSRWRMPYYWAVIKDFPPELT